MAQGNKKVVTRYGEIVTYDIRITTAERDALPDKTVGMQIFNTTTKCHEFWDGTDWYNYCWRGTTPPPVTPPPGNYPSTGGSAVVTSYNCSGTSAGTILAGTAVSGVTQTITANVASEGTYYITATAGGITFVGSGTFTATGSQTIVLTASGTPPIAASYTYTLSTSPSCSFSRSIGIGPGPALIRGSAGKLWMDRNIGASRVATSVTDYEAYGSLFQWGRGADGHEIVNWTSSTSGAVTSTTSIQSATSTPGHALFITDGPNHDWRITADPTRWDGIGGTNNPCPAGFRVPTKAEWDAEFPYPTLAATVYARLRIPAAGFRNRDNGGLGDVGKIPYLWTSLGTSQGTYVWYGDVNYSGSNTWGTVAASVRCLKD